MKKNLLICLADSSEFLLSLGVYSSLKSTYRSAHWSIITYSENKELLAVWGYVGKVTFIDRSLIQRIYSGQVFPDSFALNVCWDQIYEILQEDFDWVVNASNNQESALLCSMVKKTHLSGMHIDGHSNVKFSDWWSRYINEVYTVEPCSYNRYDLLKLMCQLPREQVPLIHFEEKNKKTYIQTFEQIRSHASSSKYEKKIIGIDLAGLLSTNIELDEFIFHLASSIDFYPILLVEKENDSHRKTAKRYANLLESHLLTVEYNAAAISAMMFHLDALITSQGVLKQAAHLTETPTLSLLEKFQSNTGYSYIENDVVVQCSSQQTNYQIMMNGLEILLLGKIKSLELSYDAKIYQVVKDDFGSFLLQINSLDKNVGNLKNYLRRLLMQNLANENSAVVAAALSELDKNWIIRLFEKAELDSVVDEERVVLEDNLKLVLSLIRSVHELNRGPQVSKKFFMNLDILMNPAEVVNIGSMIRALYRPQMLSIMSVGSDGIKELEKLLLDVKKSINMAMHFLAKARSSEKAIIHDTVNKSIELT